MDLYASARGEGSQVKVQVCLCLTPLHVLTVMAIAAQRDTQFAQGWYVCSVDTPQHRAYASQLERCCDEVCYVVESTSDGQGLRKYLVIAMRRFRLRQQFLKLLPKRITKALIPSSPSDYCYVFASTLRSCRLVTYDDGWANVQPDSPIATVKIRWSTRLLYAMTLVTALPERIRQRSERHFSLYPLPNHAHRVEVICLRATHGVYVQPALNPGAPVQHSSYLVGPGPDAGPEVYAAIERLLCKVRIDGVFAHPRDRLRKIQRVPYVDTFLIAEDYVFRLLVDQPQVLIDVYGYESSVLLNLAHVPRVKSFTICDPDVERADSVATMVSGGVLRIKV